MRMMGCRDAESRCKHAERTSGHVESRYGNAESRCRDEENAGRERRIVTPFTKSIASELRVGDPVLISGVIYTARDAAHRRMFESLDRGDELPIDIKDQIIYYAGPCPAGEGAVIGSIGPTTSGRMDAYTPKLIYMGLRGMIGKGSRSKEVINAIKSTSSVYFAAVGGAGALLARRVKSAEIVAYEDLGTEAIRRLIVEDFPVIVSSGSILFPLKTVLIIPVRSLNFSKGKETMVAITAPPTVINIEAIWIKPAGEPPRIIAAISTTKPPTKPTMVARSMPIPHYPSISGR
jgi:fumarate hydratase subunit beta